MTMRFLMAILAVILAAMILACNPVVKHARNRFPDCDVEKISADVVLVRCPGEEPFSMRHKK